MGESVAACCRRIPPCNHW